MKKYMKVKTSNFKASQRKLKLKIFGYLDIWSKIFFKLEENNVTNKLHLC